MCRGWGWKLPMQCGRRAVHVERGKKEAERRGMVRHRGFGGCNYGYCFCETDTCCCASLACSASRPWQFCPAPLELEAATEEHSQHAKNDCALAGGRWLLRWWRFARCLLLAAAKQASDLQAGGRGINVAYGEVLHVCSHAKRICPKYSPNLLPSRQQRFLLRKKEMFVKKKTAH